MSATLAREDLAFGGGGLVGNPELLFETDVPERNVSVLCCML
jgi:hypothetical protein